MEIPKPVIRDIKMLRGKPMYRNTLKAQQDLVYSEFLKIANRKEFCAHCYICNEPMNLTTKKFGWTFHHKEYTTGALSYRHFNPKKPEFMWKGKELQIKGIDTRALYRLEVFRQVRDNPRQFLLMDSAHHQTVERIDRFHPDKVKMVWKAWKMTRTKWKIK